MREQGAEVRRKPEQEPYREWVQEPVQVRVWVREPVQVWVWVREPVQVWEWVREPVQVQERMRPVLLPCRNTGSACCRRRFVYRNRDKT